MLSNLQCRIPVGVLVLLILRFTCNNLYAQNMPAITSSHYGGIYSAQLNPAATVLSPLYLDINIVAADLFVENNYIFMPREENKLQRFFNSDRPFVNSGPDKTYADYYTNSLKYGQMQARVTGPSVSLVAGRHAFGISTAVRSVTSVRDMPHTLAKFFYEGLYFPPQYDTRFVYPNKVSVASLQWAEVGLTYSTVISSNGKDLFTGGATVKRLLGYAAAYIDMDHLDYMVPNYDTLIIYNADIDAGFSLPLDYKSNDYLPDTHVRGKGMGLDAGFMWERKLKVPTDARYFRKLCGQSYIPYLFRVGVSLLDFGSIRFTENARQLGVVNGQLFWPGISDLEYTNLHDLSQQVSMHFYGDEESLVRARDFSIGLPATVSLQGDFNLTAFITGRSAENLAGTVKRHASGSGFMGRLWEPGNWFVNGIVMLPVNRTTASAVQPTMLMIGTRYESPHFQLGVTGSFYDNKYFHLGLNGRFRFFFVGTDNLLSFLKVSDYTGTSLYAGVRIGLRKGNCRELGFKCPDLF